MVGSVGGNSTLDGHEDLPGSTFPLWIIKVVGELLLVICSESPIVSIVELPRIELWGSRMVLLVSCSHWSCTAFMLLFKGSKSLFSATCADGRFWGME